MLVTLEESSMALALFLNHKFLFCPSVEHTIYSFVSSLLVWSLSLLWKELV